MKRLKQDSKTSIRVQKWAEGLFLSDGSRGHVVVSVSDTDSFNCICTKENNFQLARVMIVVERRHSQLSRDINNWQILHVIHLVFCFIFANKSHGKI